MRGGPDKTGLGCDLCRVVLLSGLNILKGGLPGGRSFTLLTECLCLSWRNAPSLVDMSKDGKWCYVVLWVMARPGRRPMAWDVLEERLVELCPVVGFDSIYLAAAGLEDHLAPAAPQVFLLKFCCYDRMGLLHGIVDFSSPPQSPLLCFENCKKYV